MLIRISIETLPKYFNLNLQLNNQYQLKLHMVHTNSSNSISNSNHSVALNNQLDSLAQLHNLLPNRVLHSMYLQIYRILSSIANTSSNSNRVLFQVLLKQPTPTRLHRLLIQITPMELITLVNSITTLPTNSLTIRHKQHQQQSNSIYQ